MHMGHVLYAISLSETLLDRSRELCDLVRPSLRIVLFEACQKGLEHTVKLRRGVIPLHDGVTEPK